eukprot:TRINITY_DN5239_c0_g2_i1.p1 TRINITY_DN5239_c0_g2~~TRINITY_DN5239_c0_g2_i1.p1  ORF type:complete len:483 (+),score=93.88 TRINITY_DN5239_c0_g2_i1:244-1692(+)
MKIVDDQLVACGFREAFVAVWIAEMGQVKPFSDNAPTEPSARRLNISENMVPKVVAPIQNPIKPVDDSPRHSKGGMAFEVPNPKAKDIPKSMPRPASAELRASELRASQEMRAPANPEAWQPAAPTRPAPEVRTAAPAPANADPWQPSAPARPPTEARTAPQIPANPDPWKPAAPAHPGPGRQLPAPPTYDSVKPPVATKPAPPTYETVKPAQPVPAPAHQPVRNGGMRPAVPQYQKDPQLPSHSLRVPAPAPTPAPPPAPAPAPAPQPAPRRTLDATVIPASRQAPLGLDINAFLPGGQPTQMGDDEILGLCMDQHHSMCGILNNRLTITRAVYTLWAKGDFRESILIMCKMKDPAVVVDVLTHAQIKTAKDFTLDMAVDFLPLMQDLLASRFEDYIVVALETTNVILKGFSALIKMTRAVASSSRGEVDISKEERLEKCNKCFAILQQIEKNVRNIARHDGRVGTHAQELLRSFDSAKLG